MGQHSSAFLYAEPRREGAPAVSIATANRAPACCRGLGGAGGSLTGHPGVLKQATGRQRRQRPGIAVLGKVSERLFSGPTQLRDGIQRLSSTLGLWPVQAGQRHQQGRNVEASGQHNTEKASRLQQS